MTNSFIVANFRRWNILLNFVLKHTFIAGGKLSNNILYVVLPKNEYTTVLKFETEELFVNAAMTF